MESKKWNFNQWRNFSLFILGKKFHEWYPGHLMVSFSLCWKNSEDTQHALRNHIEYGLTAKIRAAIRARKRWTYAKYNSLMANFNYRKVEKSFLTLKCPAKAAFLLKDTIDILDTNRHTSLSIYNFVQTQSTHFASAREKSQSVFRVLFKCDFDELNDIRTHSQTNFHHFVLFSIYQNYLCQRTSIIYF